MNEDDGHDSNRSLSGGKRARSWLFRILRMYLLVVVLLAFLQRSLLYSPSTADSLPVREHPQLLQLFPHAEDIQIDCVNESKIRGWLLKQADDQQRPLVLYFHGNAGHRVGRIPWYQILHSAGADVLAVDYQGYGDSDGKITEDTLEISCNATWKFATEQLGYLPKQMLIGGTSLGGAAATYLCSKQCREGTPPSALFVAASFSSMVDVGRSLYWWLPVSTVLIDRYPSAERAVDITCPVLVMHGDKDRLVKQPLGKRLFDAFPAQSDSGVAKRWVNLPNAGHNDLVYVCTPLIRDEVARLIEASRRD